MVNQKIALIIDDEPDVVDVVRDVLKNELHYLCLAATDPELAVDLASNYIFDLLVLDLHMPKLDGFQVLEMVRKKQPDIKVLVITGMYEQYENQLKTVKVDKIVEKPFAFPEFQASIVDLAGAVGEIPKAVGPIPKAKLLLVDDEREQCVTLREFILQDEPNRYEVEVAERADDAIVANEQFTPDVIMFDIKMPHLRGDDMMEQITSGTGHKPKQFIVVSAICLPEMIDKMEALGCLYITKPFRIEELLSTLRKRCLDLKLIEKQ